jgi:hypothetical protein
MQMTRDAVASLVSWKDENGYRGESDGEGTAFEGEAVFGNGNKLSGDGPA